MRQVIGIATTATLLVGLLFVVVSLGSTRAAPLRIARADVPAAPARAAAPSPARVAHTTSVVSARWVADTANAAGIPEPALRAYAAATLALARTDPGCHLGWTTLAGLGWVESQHGTIGGRTVAVDGRPDRPILGPALDGRHRVAAIHAPDGGWERAVGPMQFLPSTWSTWSSDGDGDGLSDPQDLDDASLAAGRYLCASGQDLATGAGWSAAVRSYNHSDAYVREVYDAASAYADRTAS
jgi:membrane-bound lytic murein transglycosylase B